MTVPLWTIEVLYHLKTQQICIEAVRIESFLLAYVLDHLKDQEMYNDVVRNKLYMMLFVSYHLKTMEMCNDIMRTMPDAANKIVG